MSKPTAVDPEFDPSGIPGAVNPATGLHHPGHSALDMAETAELDEVLHDAALRDSVLRTPR